MGKSSKRSTADEDQEDLAAFEQRASEPTITYEALLDDLKADGKMNIRSAEIKDAPEIAGLMMQLGYSVDSSLIERKLHQLSDSSIDNVFVAVLEQQVVGCISCHITTLFHQEGGSGRITSLVIDENLRGSGIGKQLVKEAEQFFQERGCIKAEVTSSRKRLEAHKFYETCGFQENDRRFSKNY